MTMIFQNVSKRNKVLAGCLIGIIVFYILALSYAFLNWHFNKVDVAEERAKIEEAIAAKTDFTINLTKNTSLKMIRVEPGSFIMGKDNSEDDLLGVHNPEPHRVTLTKPFYICETEVTEKQWCAVMKSFSLFSLRSGNTPVASAEWYNAMEFCNELNSNGFAPEGWKFTLPTEAQWEFAARGGNKSRGYKFSGSNNIDEVAWYGGNCTNLHPVKEKKANELGLYDMSGNVDEWCLDSLRGYTSDPVTDPVGEMEGVGARAYRGGGYSDSAESCYSYSRSSNGGYLAVGGFRLVLVPVN